jgi:hypothetical protein
MKMALDLETSQCFAELWPARSVPASNRIEALKLAFQLLRYGQIANPNQIDSSRSERAHCIGESNERDNSAGNPDFSEVRGQVLENWQPKDAIADGTRANEEPSHGSGSLLLDEYWQPNVYRCRPEAHLVIARLVSKLTRHCCRSRLGMLRDFEISLDVESAGKYG